MTGRAIWPHSPTEPAFAGPSAPKAAFHRDPSVPGGLSHGVQGAAYRVVQEALTLVGLTERVTALGGELRTGPRSDRRGWEAKASPPAEKQAC
jgi:hypothetical protein